MKVLGLGFTSSARPAGSTKLPKRQSELHETACAANGQPRAGKIGGAMALQHAAELLNVPIAWQWTESADWPDPA